MFHELRRMLAGTVLFNQRMATLLKVNSTDLQFLNLLELHGRLTPGRLAELSGLTTGGVTVVLNRMEKAGVIRRAPKRLTSCWLDLATANSGPSYRFLEKQMTRGSDRLDLNRPSFTGLDVLSGG